MKVVINTQIRENYGDVARPYWKFKGGEVFVVPNLSEAQTLKIKEHGIPTLKAMIETRNPMFEEYVVNWAILDDEATVCDPWETPINLFWENNRWVARRITENGEYGFMRREVASKFEQYDLCMNGERENYSVIYIMRNGNQVKGQDMQAYLAQAA